MRKTNGYCVLIYNKRAVYAIFNILIPQLIQHNKMMFPHIVLKTERKLSFSNKYTTRLQRGQY